MKLIKIISVIFLLNGCTSAIFSNVENIKRDTSKKIEFVQSINSFILTEKKYGFKDTVVKKDTSYLLQNFEKNRKIVIVNDKTSRVCNICPAGKLGMLLDNKLCFDNKIYIYSYTIQSIADKLLISNTDDKSWFSTSIPKPCFEMEK